MPFNSRVREYAGGGGGAGGVSVGGGILRRTGTTGGGASAGTSSSGASSMEARQVDLLVFGYACKVFRDDEKARDIDQGKHMITWMNDGSLKIDRYDVRGALYDLSPHEPPSGGYGNRLDYLSAEEQRAEQLCEEERYLYLYNNEEELILQQEEDLKRLKQESSGSGYSQVAFQYGNDASASGGGVQHGPNREEYLNSPTCEEAEQPFVLPKNFEVPASIQLPETMKQHAIIEKTARFIASQGVQMEILLKAKQSTNTQFEFLTQNSLLNPYYKFVTNAIKIGTFPAAPLAPETLKEPTIDEAAAAIAAAELNHIVAKPIVTVVPTIKYKPSANCAYTQLISKIKGLPLPRGADENDASTSSAEAKASATNSPSALTSSDENFTPVLLRYNGSTFITAEDSNSNSNSNSNLNTNSEVEILKNSSALALAQNYSSDSESEAEETAAATATVEIRKPEPKLNFPIPPESLKNIIDKTATYVIKNGRQFEETLRTKSEERFTFLIPENEHYPYYMYKITDDPDAASKEQKTRKAVAVAAALLSKKGLNIDKTILPVSFSIKVKDEPAPGTQPSVLPQEPSDDENDGDESRKPAAAVEAPQQAPRSVPENVQKAIQLVESQLMARNAQLAANGTPAVAAVGSAAGVAASAVIASVATRSTNVRSRFDVMDYTNPAAATAQKPHPITTPSKSTKAELERNALYEQQQQHRQKELKKAEEKVKDKLAQIAREKLGGLISKEKQLQLERKHKAMEFLNQIKGASSPIAESTVTAASTVQQQVTTKPNAGVNASDDDSDASVHSIPITSYGPDDKTDDEVEQQTATDTKKAVSPAKLKEEEERVATATVTLSDDDDVQVVSESKAPSAPRIHRLKTVQHKRRSRSRSPRRSHAVTAKQQRRPHKRRSISTSSSYDVEDDDVYIDEDSSRRSKSRHKPKSKAKKSSSSVRSKKKSKKQRSRSRSRSQISLLTVNHRQNRHQRRSKSHRRSRSEEEDETFSSASSTASREHRRRRVESSKRHHKSRHDFSPPPQPSSRRSSPAKRRDRKRKYDR